MNGTVPEDPVEQIDVVLSNGAGTSRRPECVWKSIRSRVDLQQGAKVEQVFVAGAEPFLGRILHVSAQVRVVA